MTGHPLQIGRAELFVEQLFEFLARGNETRS